MMILDLQQRYPLPSAQPIGRLGPPSEIVDLAFYRAVATCITGQIHSIDGARTL